MTSVCTAPRTSHHDDKAERFARRATMRLLLLLVLFITTPSKAFQLVMMGSRRGKGGLKKSLDPTSVGDKATKKNKEVGVNALNGGRGQEVTGITLPAEGQLQHI